MTGFLRQRQPVALDRAALTGIVRRFVAEEMGTLTVHLFTLDPFGVDDPCPFNPTGHVFIGSCGDVACIHCARVVWS